MEFRIINETEKKIINSSISKISPKIITILNEIDYQIFISINNSNLRSNYPFVYLVPNTLIKIISEFEEKKDIISAGIYFGFIKKDQFFLSLEGTDYLYKLDCFSKEQQIYATEAGEKSILYGNRILKKMIAEIPPTLKKNDFLLIFNQSNELIAIAQSQVDYLTSQNLNFKDLIALNLSDKGYYLRKKQ